MIILQHSNLSGATYQESFNLNIGLRNKTRYVGLLGPDSSPFLQIKQRISKFTGQFSSNNANLQNLEHLFLKRI